MILVLLATGCRNHSQVRRSALDAAATHTPPLAGPRPTFHDVTAEAGLSWRHHNGAKGQKQYPETMGGGGGFVDVDGDGWLDLVLIDSVPEDGGSTVALWHSEPASGGERRFVDRTASSGLRGRFFGM